MNKALSRAALIPTLLAGGFILLDLSLDRYLGGFAARLAAPHPRSIGAADLVHSDEPGSGRRKRAEAVLRQARDEMEMPGARTHGRTGQANQALWTSEETARALMNASLESAVLLDARGVVIACNEATVQQIGRHSRTNGGCLALRFLSTRSGRKKKGLPERRLRFSSTCSLC